MALMTGFALGHVRPTPLERHVLYCESKRTDTAFFKTIEWRLQLLLAGLSDSLLPHPVLSQVRSGTQFCIVGVRNCPSLARLDMQHGSRQLLKGGYVVQTSHRSLSGNTPTWRPRRALQRYVWSAVLR